MHAPSNQQTQLPPRPTPPNIPNRPTDIPLTSMIQRKIPTDILLRKTHRFRHQKISIRHPFLTSFYRKSVMFRVQNRHAFPNIISTRLRTNPLLTSRSANQLLDSLGPVPP